MKLASECPPVYRYKCHTIEPLSERVLDPRGWLYWIVCPDNGGECWRALSLKDAREGIDEALQLEALEAEGRAVLAAEGA